MRVELESIKNSLTTSEVVILGICRDVENVLGSQIANLNEAFSFFAKVHIRLVESDSKDCTIQVMEKIKKKFDNFDFESLGFLENEIPNRWERIAFCRNRVKEFLHLDPNLNNCSYVVVADLDGVNSSLSLQNVLSCWKRSDWDVCTANQSKRYYDIFALRHPTWSPNDCWEQESRLIRDGINPILAREIAVYSRQIKIPKDSNWIPVNSAFGGLAIYRRNIFLLGNYSGRDTNGKTICEHVTFHENLIRAGGKIFINPALINSGWVDHNIQHTITNRIKRKLKIILVYLKLSHYLN